VGPPDGRSTASAGAWLVALLVVGSVFTGCISGPSTQLTARRGDLAEIELVVANGGDVAWPDTDADTTELCGDRLPALGARGCPDARQRYVLAGDRPAHLPPAFANASPLTDALVDHLKGLTEDEHRLVEDVQAWGPHREGLVEEHERVQQLPRIVDSSRAYGHTWNGSPTANGSFEIEPTDEDIGRQLAVDDWCNERFCLFGSELVDWTEDHLVVRHQAQAGTSVRAADLDTYLTVVEAGDRTFTVDGNHPRAGENYTVYANLVDVRGPPEGQTRAPSFELTTLAGETISLDAMLGQPVVVEFFATWCPSCAENAGHLTQLRDEFGDRVQIVSIGVDPWESPSSLGSFVDEHGITWPVAVDEQGEVASDYGVGTLSTEVIVDAHGVIRHVETGVADHDRVVAILEGLLAEDSGDQA